MEIDNVIPFPRKRQSALGEMAPQSMEEVEDTVDIVRQAHIQQTLEQVIPMLFDNLALAGFQPIDEMVFLKDGALIVEAARSFLNKVYGMSHPLQIIAENLFVQIDGEGNLEVSDKVKIIISPTEEQS
jgi:polyhydroxyalkanoate synthesis regulator phasin